MSSEASLVSPCIRDCCLDKQDICIGCGRTVEEIIRWGDDNEKQQILNVAKKTREMVIFSYLLSGLMPQSLVISFYCFNSGRQSINSVCILLIALVTNASPEIIANNIAVIVEMPLDILTI